MNRSLPRALEPVAERGSLLLVGNYAPDVGFAWWLMEMFWVRLATRATSHLLRPILAYPQSGEVPASIRSAGIETVVFPFPSHGMMGIWRTIGFVRAHRVRIVYFTDRPFSSLQYVVLRIAGVKVIINHDHTPGDRPPVGGFKGWLKSIWRRLPWIACDMQICVSPLMLRRSIENARIPSDRLEVVQNGIEPVADTGDRKYAHRALGIPPDSIICITVGRAAPYKRIDFAIEVARICVVERQRANIFFVHCGDGPDLDRLIAVASEAGVLSHFSFAGRRTDIRSLLRSADIALHPSQGEAFSLATLEYMSAGLALIVPDIPSVSQAVEHGTTGLIYPDRDAQAASDLICHLADNETERLRIGVAASRSVSMDYSLDGMTQAFDRLIDPWLDRATVARRRTRHRLH